MPVSFEICANSLEEELDLRKVCSGGEEFSFVSFRKTEVIPTLQKSSGL